MKNIYRNILKPILTLSAIIIPTLNYAQISNCNVFMVGNRLEVGINWNGAFGASTTPPAGTHGNTNTSLYTSGRCGGGQYNGTSLGFVADPDADGWSAGTNPYYGDFILPGGANEGWSIMIDGVQKNAWNTDAANADSIDGISSYIFGYTDTNGIITAKTQAVYNGIYITQFMTLDTSKLYFTVQALIENTNLSLANDIYFMRMIMPHNDQSISGNPNTWCKILNQYPDTSSKAIVSATGTVHNTAFLAMGAKDPSATVFISKHSILPIVNTINAIASGDTNFIYTVGDSINSSTSMGLIYNVGPLTSGSFAVLNYFYAFRPDVIDDAISNIHLSVDDMIAKAVHYQVYPNPIVNSFKINGIERNDDVVLFDITGRQMACNSLGSNEFSTNDLAPGSYLLIIKDKTGRIKGRVPLQKF